MPALHVPSSSLQFSNAVRSTVAAQADMRSWSALVSRCIASSASCPRIKSCCTASSSSLVERTSRLPGRVAALALIRSGLLSREPTRVRCLQTTKHVCCGNFCRDCPLDLLSRTPRILGEHLLRWPTAVVVKFALGL